MPPKRTLSDAEEFERKRQRNEYQRQRRANMKEEQRAIERERHAEAERNCIAAMNETDRVIERERHAEAERNRIAAMNITDRAIERGRNTATRRANTITRHIAAINNLNEEELPHHNCGQLNVVCNFCRAKHYAKEQPTDKQFNICCSKGKVVMDPIRVSPLIKQLFTRQHEHSNNFHDNIRSINSALAFASLGANIAPPPGYGPYCFRINGQIYHRSGALHPSNDDQRQFAQLYILDPEEAANQRMQMNTNAQCNPQLMQ